MESDPAIKLLQADSYDQQVLSQAFDDAARQLFIAFAGGANLDHLAALYAVERLKVRFSAGPNGSTSVKFPTSFAGNAYPVMTGGTSDSTNNAQNNHPAVKTGTISPSGFQVHDAPPDQRGRPQLNRLDPISALDARAHKVRTITAEGSRRFYGRIPLWR